MKQILAGILRGILYPLFYPVVAMPGRSHAGRMPSLSAEELGFRTRLEDHVRTLSESIPDRSLGSPGLEAAAAYIEDSFRKLGYEPRSQYYELGGRTLRNVEAVLPGSNKRDEVIVLGAHYDTVKGTPGADDNASGVAALLLLAEIFAGKPLPMTIKFVAFTNEETYKYETMGSYHYAAECRQKNERIAGMFSLEMLGSFSNEKGTQNYPFPFSLFYPETGNFLAFVGNTASRQFLKASIASFRANCAFPSEGCAAPSWVSDASRSDHLSFWSFGYPAVMLTDTSNFRYPHYHGEGDSMDKLDFEAMSRVVSGMARMVQDLTRR